MIRSDTLLLEELYTKTTILSQVMSLVESDNTLTNQERNTIYKLYKEDKNLLYSLVIEADMSRRGFLGNLLKGAAAVGAGMIANRMLRNNPSDDQQKEETPAAQEPSPSSQETKEGAKLIRNPGRDYTKENPLKVCTCVGENREMIYKTISSSKMPFEQLKGAVMEALKFAHKQTDVTLKEVQKKLSYKFILSQEKANLTSQLEDINNKRSQLEGNLKDIAEMKNINELKQYIKTINHFHVGAGTVQTHMSSKGLNSAMSSFSSTTSNLGKALSNR